MRFTEKSRIITLTPQMSDQEIASSVPEHLQTLRREVEKHERPVEWTVLRERCFFSFALKVQKQIVTTGFSPSSLIEPQLQNVIHVPGLRGNPERTYKTTAVGSRFPGTFENYVASIISDWQARKPETLKTLGSYLEDLGLTWKVESRQVDDTQVELRVGRLTHAKRGGAKDLVSIADVGFGVSQSLPVLVALLVAKPGQLVYLEQPEIHLHPRAQTKLAKILADAAQRGVQVSVETHSSLLLRSIQTLVATGDLSEDLVKLHWFRRRPDGVTEIQSADLDRRGAFGDWPEDFDEVMLDSERAYLDARESVPGRGRSARRNIMKKNRDSKLLVIDASVARAAGATQHPTSKACRDFLMNALTICHRTLMTQAIMSEWRTHQSGFARTWLTSMTARKKVVRRDDLVDQALRAAIQESKLRSKQIEAILKDIHLVEAALEADGIVVSLDDAQSKLINAITPKVRSLQGVSWKNPLTSKQ